MASRHGAKSKQKVARAMSKRKKGTLKSGSGRTVKSRKQAIAIGLSEARREGGKAPPRKKGSSSSRRKSTARGNSSSGRKATSRRKSAGGRKNTRGTSARKSTRSRT